MLGLLRRIEDHFLPSKHNDYKPHLLSKRWLLFFLTIIFTAEGVLFANFLSHGTQELSPAAVVPAEVIALTNDQRVALNEGSLTENAQLDAAAQAKANDMAAKGYFAHVSPDGTQPWAWITGAGYAYKSAGENLAVRFDDSTSVVNAWMASPTHRANIVKPVYTEIGVATAQGVYEGSEATFIVQYFGTPLLQVVSTAPKTPAPSPAVASAASINAAPQVEGTSTVENTNTTLEAGMQPVPLQVDVWKQQVAQFAADIPQTSLFILGGVALLLVVMLILTFIIHIEVQPSELLLGGASVAVLAISLLALNVQFFPTDTSQGASVVTSAPPGLVGEAASI